MVGKPNIPPDADEREDARGSATPEPGLTALDQEREASLADEGGASGAAVEGEDATRPAWAPGAPERRRRPRD